MKLKRWLTVACLGLAVSVLLTGCTGKPLPKEMDEKTVIAAGQEIFDFLLAGDYEAIVARLREDIRNQPGKEITPDIVRQLVDEKLNPEEVGAFKKISSTATEGVNESGTEPHGVAIFHCEFKEEKVGFGFAFDLEMNLIGLSLARE